MNEALYCNFSSPRLPFLRRYRSWRRILTKEGGDDEKEEKPINELFHKNLPCVIII
jgi:hypothetical protein